MNPRRANACAVELWQVAEVCALLAGLAPLGSP